MINVEGGLYFLTGWLAHLLYVHFSKPKLKRTDIGLHKENTPPLEPTFGYWREVEQCPNCKYTPTPDCADFMQENNIGWNPCPECGERVEARKLIARPMFQGGFMNASFKKWDFKQAPKYVDDAAREALNK